MSRNTNVEINVEVRAETKYAILVFDGKTEAWVPKSQINDQCDENGRISSIFIPEWLALAKGLI